VSSGTRSQCAQRGAPPTVVLSDLVKADVEALHHGERLKLLDLFLALGVGDLALLEDAEAHLAGREQRDLHADVRGARADAVKHDPDGQSLARLDKVILENVAFNTAHR
jgi:hypothetical protein